MKIKPTKALAAEHALLSPSAAKKWLGCPASLACEVGIPNESGAAAVDGTAMHHLAEIALQHLKETPDFNLAKWFAPLVSEKVVVRNYGKGPMCSGEKSQPGDVLVTEDFVTQVSKYVNYCAPIMAAAEVVEIEAKVSLTRLLHPGFEMFYEDPRTGARLNMFKLETFGTADFVALLKNSDGSYTLIVGDLKTGRHKVNATENKQMMLYAMGLMRKYSRTYEISAVKLFIFQPYAGGTDEWDTTPTALEHFGKFASKQALKALGAYQRGKKGLKPADFRPSSDACQWCRFAEQCGAKAKAVSHTAEEIMDLSDEIELTPAMLKAEWDKLPLMRQHIDDIEKAMYASLMRGDKVEGLKLVEGRPGNRAWSDAAAVETYVRSNGAGDLMYKQALLSPTEAEKALKGNEYWGVIEQFITRKPGQPSIAAADDKRPAWAPVSDSDLE